MKTTLKKFAFFCFAFAITLACKKNNNPISTDENFITKDQAIGTASKILLSQLQGKKANSKNTNSVLENKTVKSTFEYKFSF